MTTNSPTSQLTLQRATAEDWPAIWAILQSVVQAGETFVYDPDLNPESYRLMWSEPAPAETWVLRTPDGEVIGAYKTGPNRPGPGAHVGTCTYMVAEAARGHGAGRTMVQHSLERARAVGYRGMQFNAVAASNVYAIKLYLDLGFYVAGTIPGGFRHPSEGYVDLLIMYRDLTDS